VSRSALNEEQAVWCAGAEEELPRGIANEAWSALASSALSTYPGTGLPGADQFVRKITET